MDVERFLQFRAAARLNHLGRAAEELQVSQPALSQTVKRLETHYGLPLFDRVGRTLRLNNNGEVLLAHVERALLALDDAERAMRDLRRDAQPSIALGYFGGRDPKALPFLMREFQRDGAAVDFAVVRGTSGQLFAGLRDGSIDFAFTALMSDDDAIVGQPLWYENLYLHVAANHRLAARGVIDLAEVANEPMLALRQGTDQRTITDGLFAAAGFVPHIVFEGQNNVTLHGLVAANLGVALAPALAANESDVVALVVRSPVCVRTICLSWVRGRYFSPEASAFRDFVLARRTRLQAAGIEPIP